MIDPRSDEFQAFIFKNRGALLAIPAVLLAVFGKPGAFSVTVGVPIAIAGELLRCWAVGYSGVTTREDHVIAPELVTAGPYAYVRNPLYVGNFITAAGFALAFTGGNTGGARAALIAVSLGTMAAVYATIVPHEEQYLKSQFGEPYERYCAEVPQIMPSLEPHGDGRGTWKAGVIAAAEKNTFLTFGAMLAVLALKALKASAHLMLPRSRLLLSLALVACVAVLEVWGGFRSGSLALLTDAVHVCMDVFALAVAFFALAGAQRPPSPRKTFGYGRIEILGALFNGSVLLGLTAFIIFEAVQRFFHVSHPQGGLMSAVAGAGLIVNAAVALLLRETGKHNLNLQAALFHVAGDALGAFAVIVGGAAIAITNATWIDPALSLFVSGIIVIGVLRVLRDAGDVLLEGVPRHLDLTELRGAISSLEGAVAVHDLHVWTIGSGAMALSAHIQVEDRSVSEATSIARAVDAMVRERYGITHVTLQFECETCSEDERVVCTQKRAEL